MTNVWSRCYSPALVCEIMRYFCCAQHPGPGLPDPAAVCISGLLLNSRHPPKSISDQKLPVNHCVHCIKHHCTPIRSMPSIHCNAQCSMQLRSLGKDSLKTRRTILCSDSMYYPKNTLRMLYYCSRAALKQL